MGRELGDEPVSYTHLTHRCHARGVPSRNIAIETALVIESVLHVRHQAHVPFRHHSKFRGRGTISDAVSSDSRFAQARVYSGLKIRVGQTIRRGASARAYRAVT